MNIYIYIYIYYIHIYIIYIYIYPTYFGKDSINRCFNCYIPRRTFASEEAAEAAAKASEEAQWRVPGPFNCQLRSGCGEKIHGYGWLMDG